MRSDTELKKKHSVGIEEREHQISQRLNIMIGENSYRAISELTGYNTETVRRYICGLSKVPADFIGRVAELYGLDANQIILGHRFIEMDSEGSPLQQVSTENLINEIGRRLTMIEDCAVGSAAVKQSF